MSDPQKPDAAGDQSPQNPYASQPTSQAQNPYAAQQPNPYAAQPQQPNPYAAPAYAAAPAGPSRLNVLGLVSLIAGGVAFLFGLIFSWIPIVGFVFTFIALVGVGLGIAGLIVKNKGKGLAIAGTIVSAIAMLMTAVIGIFMLAILGAFSSALDGIDEYDFDEPAITDPFDDETASDPNALGSLSNPAAPGDIASFTDLNGDPEWEILIQEPVFDATAEVVAENSLNAPDDGNVLVLVPVNYTYLGSAVGLVSSAVDFEVIDGAGEYHSMAVVAFPYQVFDAPPLEQGSSTTVNVIFEIPEANVAGSLLGLFPSWSNELYVALD